MADLMANPTLWEYTAWVVRQASLPLGFFCCLFVFHEQNNTLNALLQGPQLTLDWRVTLSCKLQHSALCLANEVRDCTSDPANCLCLGQANIFD